MAGSRCGNAWKPDQYIMKSKFQKLEAMTGAAELELPQQSGRHSFWANRQWEFLYGRPDSYSIRIEDLSILKRAEGGEAESETPVLSQNNWKVWDCPRTGDHTAHNNLESFSELAPDSTLTDGSKRSSETRLPKNGKSSNSGECSSTRTRYKNM